MKLKRLAKIVFYVKWWGVGNDKRINQWQLWQWLVSMIQKR